MISDGVIVIIITLMVFEIKLPEETGITTFSSFLPLFRHVAIFAMSFLVLAVMWINHHQIFIGVEKVSPKIVWLNFLLLFCMSLIPLPTKALGQNIYEPVNHVFYGLILCCNSIAFTVLQNEVNKISNHLTSKAKRNINLKNIFACSLYGISMALAYVHISLSLAVFVMIPAMYFLPSTKHLNRQTNNKKQNHG